MAEDKDQSADTRLAEVIQYYQSSADATYAARQNAERDRDYVDNKQWTSAEEAELKKRGQPCVTINRIKPKVDYLLGLERRGRTDPRAFPRTPMDEDAAHAATDAIRYVCDIQDFSEKRSDVFDNVIVEGFGGLIIEANAKQEILLRRIPWDRLFYDHHSRERNFSDARYVGIVMWMDEDAAVAMYGKEAKEVLANCQSVEGDNDSTYEDKPQHQRWYDGKRKRVKLCETYYRESGRWMHCVYTKAGFIIEPHDSPYLDEDGEPGNPIQLVSCHVDRDGNRYGVVRQLIGPQDEVNKRRSKALHLLSVQKIISERGAVDDIQRAKKEFAKPDGWIERNPGMEVEVIQTSDLAKAHFDLLQEAKGEIDAVGANAALQGKEEGSDSGRALMAKQQGGLTELGPVYDALKLWQRAVYRQIWARIKQFWTAEKWIRVTDDEKNVQFVALNQQAIDPATGQPTLQNDVSRMDVDIILDDVPDVVSIQAEEFQMLSEAYKANPQTPVNPQGIPFDIVIESSNLRSKDKILQRLRGEGPDGQPLPQQGQPQIPPEVQAHQMNMMGFEAAGAEAKAMQERARAEQEAVKVEQLRAQIENERTKPEREAQAQREQLQHKAQQAAQKQDAPARKPGEGRQTDQALMTAISGLTAIVQELHKPRVTTIQHDENGRPVGAISAPAQ